MKLRRLFGAKDSTSNHPAREHTSPLALDGWQGHWPEDDTPAERVVADDVPMILNPHSPTIAPS